MKAIIVCLECITNMHVGNGDVNYNIIDNEVEKDPVTGYPTINASGVKGALREYFSVDPVWKSKVNEMFGSDERGNSTPGMLKILGAGMIAIPARASKGAAPYYLVTTNAALEAFKDQIETFLNKEEVFEPITAQKGCAVEGIELTAGVRACGKELFVIEEKDFRKLALPVMARNKLDNGISKNLWYEEVVPHKSLFFFPVLANDKDEALLSEFVKAVRGKVVQFGGNASIGYGLCKVTVMEA